MKFIFRMNRQGSLLVQVVVLSGAMIAAGMGIMAMLQNAERSALLRATQGSNETLRDIVENNARDLDALLQSGQR